MRNLLTMLFALILAGCSVPVDAVDAHHDSPTPVGSTPAGNDAGAAVAVDAAEAADCVPDTVACAGGVTQLCSGDAHWISMTLLASCLSSCAAPTGRFLVNVDDNETTDTTTGLVWMWRAGSGVAPCSEYGAGFRVPTEAEMLAILPGDSCSPDVDSAAFADVADFYNVEIPTDAGFASGYYDARGNSFAETKPSNADAATRCVR